MAKTFSEFANNPKLMKLCADLSEDCISKLIDVIHTFQETGEAEGIPPQAFAGLTAKHMVVVGVAMLKATGMDEDMVKELIQRSVKSADRIVDRAKG